MREKTKKAVDELECSARSMGSGPSIQFMLAEILRNCRTPSELFELCYWSQEPGLFDIYRSVARLPEPTRKALETLLSHANENSEVTLVKDRDGNTTQICLCLSNVKEPASDAS